MRTIQNLGCYAVILIYCLFIKQVFTLPFPRSQEAMIETTYQDEPTATDVADNQTTLVVMVAEPSNFWNDLYYKLKEIFYSVFPTDIPITESDLENLILEKVNELELTTYEPTRTDNQMTINSTTQISFKDFFGSIANTFASIYKQFGSKSTNSSDIVSNLSTPRQVFENKIEQLMQNYTLPINNANFTEEFKILVLDALMSAWNDSLDVDELLIENPGEISHTFVDALQEIQDEQVLNATEIITTTTEKTPFAMDLDTFSANFLAILKQAEVKPKQDPDPPSRGINNMHSSTGNAASWQEVLRIGSWGGK